MQLSRRARWLLLACAAIVLIACCAAITHVEAKAASKPSTPTHTAASSSSSTGGETAAAREIRERKALRDHKIAEKKARKQEKAAAAAAAARKAEEEAAAAAKKKQADATAADFARAQLEAEASANEAKAKRAAEEAATAAAAAAAKQKANRTPAEKQADAEREAAAAKRQQAADAKKQANAQRKKLSLAKARKRNAASAERRRARRARYQEREAKRRAAADTRRKKRIEAARPDIIARGQEKLRWFEKTVAGANTPRVVDISYAAFKKYVHASPRPFWLFVVFTALGDQYTCSICKGVEPEIKKLAKLYYQDRRRIDRERKANGTYSEEPLVISADVDDPIWSAEAKRSMPIFFVQVDIEHNREVFRALGMQSAPTMIMLPPTAAGSPAPLPALISSLPSRNKFQMTKQDISAVELNDFIGKVVGQSVSLTQAREPGLAGWIALGSSMLNLMDPVRYLLLCVATAMLLLLAALFTLQQLWRAVARRSARSARARGVVARELTAKDLVPLRVYSQYASELSLVSRGTPSLTRSSIGVAPSPLFLKPRTLGLMRWWFVCASCLVYLFGISGGMFNILRGTVHFPADFWSQPWRIRLNVWRYINEGDSHDQTVMEGLALGMLQLSLASILILLNRTSFTDREMRAPGAPPKTIAARAISVGRWLLSCLYSPLLWGTLFFLGWRLILSIYSKKSGSYRMGFVWKHFQPHHLKFVDAWIAKAAAYLPAAVAKMIPKMF